MPKPQRVHVNIEVVLPQWEGEFNIDWVRYQIQAAFASAAETTTRKVRVEFTEIGSEL